MIFMNIKVECRSQNCVGVCMCCKRADNMFLANFSLTSFVEGIGAKTNHTSIFIKMSLSGS